MKDNCLVGGSKIPECTIKFNADPGNAHVSQILAGYKLLDKQKIVKIKSARPYSDFRSSKCYEHNSIVEVEIDGKLICYDMADGYQSIHRKNIFDEQLDRLDFYFKRSYDPGFHLEMTNKNKVKPLGLNYYCTCKGNPYDSFVRKELSTNELLRFLVYKKNLKKNTCEYTMFESNNQIYTDYNILFLTRVWDSKGITEGGISKTYPYLSSFEVAKVVQEWKDSLDMATENRIRYIKEMRNYFGDKAIAGVSRDSFSEKYFSEFIVDDSLSNKNNYIQLIKKNFICVTSEGLHKSIGWKFAEYVAAGKAILTEPLKYVIPNNFEQNKNYLVYTDVDSCIANCEFLINNVDKVNEMEKANREYYQEHLSPDKVVLDTLKYLY